jgi:hypothetical protein
LKRVKSLEKYPCYEYDSPPHSLKIVPNNYPRVLVGPPDLEPVVIHHKRIDTAVKKEPES